MTIESPTDGPSKPRIFQPRSTLSAPVIPVEVIQATMTRHAAWRDAESPLTSNRLRGIVTIRVDCTVTEGEPSSARPAVRADPARLLLAACRLAGLKGERLADVIKAAILEALDVADVPQEQQLTLDLVGSLIERLQGNAAATLPPSRCGETWKVTGLVELVSFQPK
jgi:hypothetical protein